VTQLVESDTVPQAPAKRQIVVIRLGEIVLKKKNRPMFVRQLARNVRRATRDLGIEGVGLMPNRILLTPGQATPWPELRERLGRVFGVKNFSLCQALPWAVDAIEAEVLGMAAARSFESFRIHVQRSDKRFPGTSKDLEVRLGRAVQDLTQTRVDLEQPDVSFNVEIQPGAAYVHDERIEGPAGLPAGISGRVVVLLSGGIDSPVAAWRMIGRGCNATFVHFMSFPYLDASSRDKAIALVRSLTRWQFESRLHVVSFGDVQQQIVASCPPKLRVVLYRRFMVRIAEAIAKRARAEALVTGESLGQVSSQTLSNMATIDAAASLPILRPLVGRDKDEIINEARRIETYDISIEPDQDCCTLFVPNHPATSSRLDEVEAAEAGLDVDGLVAQALEQTERLTFSWPELPSPPTPLPRAGEGS
jgi:thiamine biosynthesis protein ThiI